jgi:hypothetical protein
LYLALMFRFLLYFFLIYLAYQFLFKFLIPVFRTTQQVKKDVRAKNDRMNEFARAQRNMAEAKSKSPDKSSKEPIGDYIDFEEIK